MQSALFSGASSEEFHWSRMKIDKGGVIMSGVVCSGCEQESILLHMR